MNALKTKAISILSDSRKELVDIDHSNLDVNNLTRWFNRWKGPFTLVESVPGSGLILVNINNYMIPINTTGDKDVLDEVRTRIVDLIDRNTTGVDSTQKVKPILEELTASISDKKLAKLLLEFNDAKDNQPNISSIAFRTILAITIKLVAKKLKPRSKLAQGDDTGKFEDTLQGAVDEKEGIFDSGEKKLIEGHLKAGDKFTFDNVTHKLGETHLVDKDNLSAAVDLEVMLLKKLK